jgi:DoxX-like family
MSALVVVFLLFDTIIHLTKPAPVVDAFAKLGFPLSASVGIGIVEFLCLVVYVIPRTAALGAIATHVRAGSPAFEAYVFPILLGLLIWGGVWLRDERLRAAGSAAPSGLKSACHNVGRRSAVRCRAWCGLKSSVAWFGLWNTASPKPVKPSRLCELKQIPGGEVNLR